MTSSHSFRPLLVHERQTEFRRVLRWKPPEIMGPTAYIRSPEDRASLPPRVVMSTSAIRLSLSRWYLEYCHQPRPGAIKMPNEGGGDNGNCSFCIRVRCC
jgi:hypothetical protein